MHQLARVFVLLAAVLATPTSSAQNPPPPVVGPLAIGALALGVSPTTITFPPMRTRDAAVTRYLQVSNAGAAELVVRSMTLAGDRTQFSATNWANAFAWPAGAAAQPSAAWVIYHPQRIGTHSATLTITYEYGEEQIKREEQRARGIYQPPIARLRERLDALKVEGPDYSAIDLVKMRAQVAFERAKVAMDRRVSDAERAVRKLVGDKDAALRELRRGAFCSECGDTETEKGGPGPFREHIAEGAAHGRVAVPATQKQIDEKAQKYDAKIAQARAAADAVRDEVAKQLAQETALLELKIASIEQSKEVIKRMYQDEVDGLDARIKRDTAWLAKVIADLEAMSSIQKTETVSVSGKCTE